MKLYTSPGSGATIIELASAFWNVDLELKVIEWTDKGHTDPRLKKLNPLRMVPTLEFKNGEIMTESAAILFYLQSKNPKKRLIPKESDQSYRGFLRWLFFINTHIYPTFTFGDFPERFVKKDPKALTKSTDERRKKLWKLVEEEVQGPYFLGKKLCAIDLYLAVMVFWRPRSAWFKKNCPKIYRIAQRIAHDPTYSEIIQRNYPQYSI